MANDPFDPSLWDNTPEPTEETVTPNPADDVELTPFRQLVVEHEGLRKWYNQER